MESPFPKELTLQQVRLHASPAEGLSLRSAASTSIPRAVQAFSDYQIQQMTANFVDQFGFNDEEFTDHDDSIG